MDDILERVPFLKEYRIAEIDRKGMTGFNAQRSKDYYGVVWADSDYRTAKFDKAWLTVVVGYVCTASTMEKGRIIHEFWVSPIMTFEKPEGWSEAERRVFLTMAKQADERNGYSHRAVKYGKLSDGEITEIVRGMNKAFFDIEAYAEDRLGAF